MSTQTEYMIQYYDRWGKWCDWMCRPMLDLTFAQTKLERVKTLYPTETFRMIKRVVTIEEEVLA